MSRARRQRCRQAPTGQRAATLLVLVGMGAVGCECTPIDVAELTSDLVVETDRVVFEDDFVGVEQEKTIRFENRGNAAATLEYDVIGDGFAVDGDTLVIASGSFALLPLAHFPVQPGAFNGALRLQAESLRLEETQVDDARERLTVELAARVVTQPDCDDDNPCTDDTFDVVSGECTSLAHTRACEEDNLCVVDGRCAEGICVGTPRVCETTSPCQTGICDPTQGCMEVDTPNACDDGDPCTEGVCRDQGCETIAAPDLTPCGPTIECVSAQTCLSGVCTVVPIPDGIVCDENSLCGASTCRDNECVAPEPSGPPVVLQRIAVPGGKASTTISRPNSQLVVFDPPTVRNDFATSGVARTYGPGVDGDPVLLEERVIDEVPVNTISGGSSSPWIGLGRRSSGYTHVARLELGVPLAPVQIPNSPLHLAFRGDTAIVCGAAADPVGIFDLDAVPLQYAITLNSEDLRCDGIAIDDVTGLAALYFRDEDVGEVRLVNIASPSAPIEVARVSVPRGGGIGAGGGTLVVSGRSSTGDWLTESISILDLEATSLFPPEGFAFPGTPTVIDGDIYQVWTQDEAFGRGALFRRQVNGGGAWEEIENAATQFRFAQLVTGANMLAISTDVRGTTLLNYNHPTRDAFTRAPVEHGRFGDLFFHSGNPLSIAPGLLREINLDTDDDGGLFVSGVGTVGAFPSLPGQIDLFSGVHRFWIDTVRQALVADENDIVFNDTIVRLDLDPNPPRLRFREEAAPVPLGLSQVASAATTPENMALAYTRADSPNVIRLRLNPVIANGATGAFSWVPTADVVVTESEVPPSEAPLIAMGGNSIAVLTPESQMAFLFRIEEDGAVTPVASRNYANDPTPFFNRIAVHGDQIVLGGPTVTTLYSSNDSTLERIWSAPLFNVRILKFLGRYAIVERDTGLEFVSMVSGFNELWSIELGERPVDVLVMDGHLLVTTDHEIIVLGSSCF